MTSPTTPAGAGGGQTATSVDTTTRVAYWTYHRFLIVAGAVAAIISPLNFGIEGYSFIGPMLTPCVIALALILWKDRGWTYLTAGILASLFPTLVLVMFVALSGELPAVQNGPEWAATLLNVLALCLALTGGIGGYRRSVGNRHVRFGFGWKTTPGIVSLIVLSVILGSTATGYVAKYQAAGTTASGYDFAPAASVPVEINDGAFPSNALAIALNTQTEIAVTNSDAEAHTFTYKNGDAIYDHELLGGNTAKFLVLFTTAGTYQYWCEPHSSGEPGSKTGMTGSITVA